MGSGRLSDWRCFNCADVADTPFCTSPYTFVFYDISCQLCTRIEAVGDMCHFQHTFIVKAFQEFFIFRSFAAAFDFYDNAVFYSQFNRLRRHVSEWWGNCTVENDFSVDGTELRNDIELAWAHVKSRNVSFAAVYGYSVRWI